MAKQRLLLITRNFPPLWGGMERLNWHLAAEAAKYFTTRCIAPIGAKTHAPEGILVSELPLRPLWRFILKATALALWQSQSFKPDIVLAGSGLIAPIAWIAARLARAHAVAYVHGLDLTVPHPIYRAFWLPALRHMDRVIANSAATANLAKNIGIPAERIAIVHPGVSMPALAPEARQRFRKIHGLGEAPVLLSIGRLTTRKGLKEFVVEVLPHIVEKQPNALLVVVGDTPINALYAEPQTRGAILSAAKSAGVGNHVMFLGVMFGEALAEAYAGADVHVFPVRQLPDDPEGFGMVAIEAAAHGLPTVAYATGGVVDAVREGISGRLVKPGDSQAFADAVIAMYASPPPNNGIRNFASEFEWQNFGEKIVSQLLYSRVDDHFDSA